jgi:hypothetical protein
MAAPERARFGDLPDFLTIKEVGALLGYGTRFTHRHLHEFGIAHIDPRPHTLEEANGVRGVRVPKAFLMTWRPPDRLVIPLRYDP